jgi:hypothetical protein
VTLFSPVITFETSNWKELAANSLRGCSLFFLRQLSSDGDCGYGCLGDMSLAIFTGHCDVAARHSRMDITFAFSTL